VSERLEDLGILVGFLLTDGCVSGERFIVFHNKSEVMHELFREQVSKIFGTVHFTERRENNGTIRTQISNKTIVKKLMKICNIKTFRRKQFKNGEFPPVKLPTFFKNLPRSSILKVLQVIFSADGSISLSVRWHKNNNNWEIRRRIELACKHPKLRNEFFKLIKGVGFSPRISGENITLERKDDILKFAKEIRFVPGVKVGGDSKIWKGFEKNKVLDIAVKTLELKGRDLKIFSTKMEIIEFLKSL